ncbi:MAG: glycosyltransferase family 4 protein [Gammaproteobacteria bacterium]
MIIASIVIASFILSLWLTHRLCRATGRWRILDQPNARSLHSTPVPRTGGLAIIIAVLAGFALLALTMEVPPMFYWMTGSMVLLAVVAWFDDVDGVHIVGRLLVQILTVLLLLFGGGFLAVLLESGYGLTVGTVIFVITVLVVVWMVNLYNFMDGMDGLAAGMGAIGFACLGILGWLAEDWVFASLALVVASSSLGFLVFNFPPARIFMGDTGSYSLGFLAAALSLWGVGDGLFSVWCPILIFSPFIIDASVTLTARAWRRERLWEAHKGHFYQRLAVTGWSHRRIALGAYGLMMACGASALCAGVFGADALRVIVPVWMVLYTVLLRLIIRLERLQRSYRPPS